jgi:hypothetical protein
MPGVTHLAAESPPSTIEYALKSAGMLALMILLKFGAHLSDPSLSLNHRHVNCCITIYYFFRSLHYSVRICVRSCIFSTLRRIHNRTQLCNDTWVVLVS